MIGPFLDAQGNLINDEKKMAEILKCQYESAFSVPAADRRIDDPQDRNNLQLPSFPFNHNDINDAIDCLPINAAPGPDYFPAILLKKAKMELCWPLMVIFRSSLDTGEVPDMFKTAFITPIHKGGSKNLPINFRPVSLTSHLVKTMEWVIRKPLVSFLEMNGKMNESQHGYRKGRSCVSALLEHQDRVMNILENGDNADCIYSDYSKCFDKIDISILCSKLKESSINGKLGIWT